MKLKEWSKITGITADIIDGTGVYIHCYNVDRRRELENLIDYMVAGVAGSVIYLVPRTKSTDERRYEKQKYRDGIKEPK